MSIENVGPGGVRRSGGVRSTNAVNPIKDVAGGVGSTVYDEAGNLLGIPVKALTTSSYSTVKNDKILSNNTATNNTTTVVANTVPDGIIIQQLSTGTCTVAAGAGVTFIGSTLATSSAGQQIAVFKTPIANTYNVKVA